MNIVWRLHRENRIDELRDCKKVLKTLASTSE